MKILDSIQMWTLIHSPLGNCTVWCHWVYVVKVGVDRVIVRMKVHLVAKSYTHMFALDYNDTPCC